MKYFCFFFHLETTKYIKILNCKWKGVPEIELHTGYSAAIADIVMYETYPTHAHNRTLH